MVSDKHDSLSESRFNRSFLYLPKCLSHDCDKHVHKHNCDNERGQEEHAHCGLTVWALCVDFTIEGSECTQKVCGDEDIGDFLIVIRFPVFAATLIQIQVVLDDIKVVTKRKDDDGDHSHEWERIRDRLHDQLHKVSKRREQSHPVEHFEPHKEAREGSVRSQSFQAESFITSGEDASSA